jgi:hypothetical protein
MNRDDQLTEAQERTETMTEPEFDGLGYPTERTLQVIERWPAEDVSGCLDFMIKGWYEPGASFDLLRPEELAVVGWTEGKRYVRFATGGWSGNEDLIRALRRNRLINAQAWCLTARGGLHIYQRPTA